MEVKELVYPGKLVGSAIDSLAGEGTYANLG